MLGANINTQISQGGFWIYFWYRLEDSNMQKIILTSPKLYFFFSELYPPPQDCPFHLSDLSSPR